MKKHSSSLKRKDQSNQNTDKPWTKKPKLESITKPPRVASECDVNWKRLQSELQKKPSSKSSKRVKNGRACKQKQADPEIWFDDVSQEDILQAEGVTAQSASSSETNEGLVKKNAFEGMTKAVGIDCEMVGTGKRGSHSALARVSLVNQYGKRIYDKHVRVDEEVTDYRTWVSGIRPSDLEEAEEFTIVQREVAEILKDRILVGHALHHDLKSLFLNHPKRLIRDTSVYPPFLVHNNGRTPSLRVLSAKVLGVKVQSGEHSSVQDAQAAMKLYMMHKKQWEKELRSKSKKWIVSPNC